MSLFIILIYVETIGNFYLKQDYLLFSEIYCEIYCKKWITEKFGLLVDESLDVYD